jgi:hypothetical protein
VGFYKLVTVYIRRRIREGGFCKVNPEIAARGLIGMISYHGLVALLFPGRFRMSTRRRVVDETVTLFLNGISVR